MEHKFLNNDKLLYISETVVNLRIFYKKVLLGYFGLLFPHMIESLNSLFLVHDLIFIDP